MDKEKQYCQITHDKRYLHHMIFNKINEKAEYLLSELWESGTRCVRIIQLDLLLDFLFCLIYFLSFVVFLCVFNEMFVEVDHSAL